MFRVVVAVLLTVALLAVSLPAVETARREHSAGRVHAELDGLTAAIRDVRARESTVPGGRTGARRVVTVRVPARSWTDAGVDFVAIGGHPDRPGVDERNESTFVWRVPGRATRTRRLSDVAVEGMEPAGDSPLVIRKPGVHRLAVSLVARGDRTVVVVRRLSAA